MDPSGDLVDQQHLEALQSPASVPGEVAAAPASGLSSFAGVMGNSAFGAFAQPWPGDGAPGAAAGVSLARAVAPAPLGRLGGDADRGDRLLSRQLVSSVLARKGSTTGSKNADFDEAEQLEHPSSKTQVKAGDTGYAEALSQEADQMAGPMHSFYEGDTLKAIAPDNSGVDAQIKTRAGEMAYADNKIADGESKKWFGGNPASVRQMWLDGKTFAQNHMQSIQTDKEELGRVATSFSAQLPTMNGVFTSMARLDSMKAALGVGKDADLATALVKGIGDAKKVLEAYLKDYRGDPTKPGAPNKQHTTEELKAPIAATSLTQQQETVALAGREMNDAYRAFRASLLDVEAAKIEKEADEPEERLKQIQDTKDAIKKAGGAIDTGFAMVNAAPATIAKAETTLAKTQAQYGAMQNKKAIVKGEFGKHNPTYLTVDEKGNFVVKNVQTGGTKNADGSPSEAPAEAAPETAPTVSLPKSVEETLGKIADFYYADEVRKLTLQVQNIKDRAGSLKKVAAAEKLAVPADNFQTKLLAFAKACNDFQTAVNQRREDYREMGRKLDHFAQRSPELKKDGLDVKNFGDRFTTLFTVIAQVRETLAIGKGAKQDPLTKQTGKDMKDTTNAGEMAKSPDALRKLKARIKTKRAERKLWVNQLAITKGEEATIDGLKDQLEAYDKKTAPTATDFGTVEKEFQAFLAMLSNVPANSEY